jgi:DNA-binding transcriptional LysR family regulator
MDRRQRGDPPRRYPTGAPGRRQPSWEAVHAFLQVIEHGSFRSAALQLGLPINRLRQRVAKLEQQLGATLLTRHVDGVRATAEGEQVLAAARNMETAYFGVMRAKEVAHPSSAGEVKLAVTEGLGTFWLAPRLAEFHRGHPNLLVDLRCAMLPADMLRLEADAAVQLIRPAEADLEVVRLGRLHVIPYAAASYVEAYGVPSSVDELSGHRLVFQISEQTPARDVYASVLGDRPQAPIRAAPTRSRSAAAPASAGFRPMRPPLRRGSSRSISMRATRATSGSPVIATSRASRACATSSTGPSIPSIRADSPGSATSSFIPGNLSESIAASRCSASPDISPRTRSRSSNSRA